MVYSLSQMISFLNHICFAYSVGHLLTLIWIGSSIYCVLFLERGILIGRELVQSTSDGLSLFRNSTYKDFPNIGKLMEWSLAKDYYEKSMN